MNDPKLIITSSTLDLDLCELLGDKPSDFVILLANGKQVPGYGSPYDSPIARKNADYICSRLNEDGKDSWWPEFEKNWKEKLAEIGISDRPVFSFELHRVCPGRSEYLHCAIRLFEELGDRVRSWAIGSDSTGRQSVDIVSKQGRTYEESGDRMSLVIGLAVKRLLLDMANDKSSDRA